MENINLKSTHKNTGCPKNNFTRNDHFRALKGRELKS